MIIAAYLQSLRECLRIGKLFPWLIIAILGWAFAAEWGALNVAEKPIDTFVHVGSIMIFRMLALAAVIFTSNIISGEVEQKTIVYLLTRPIPRWQLLLGRYLAVVSALIIIGILFMVAVALGAFKGAWPAISVFEHAFTAIFFGSFAYASVFLLFSLLINKSMLVSLLFAFGWETSVPNLPGNAYQFSVFTHLIAIFQSKLTLSDNSSGMAIFTTSTNAASETIRSAILILTGISVVAYAICTAWFTVFEFVPREDGN